jgi:hypothetical protein
MYKYILYIISIKVPLNLRPTLKKRLKIFPSPAGMSLTKLSLDGKIFTLLGRGKYIPNPSWRNVNYKHGRGTKFSGINRGLVHSQNCNFPEESFILISFCYSDTLTPRPRVYITNLLPSQDFQLDLFNTLTPSPYIFSLVTRTVISRG